MPHVLAVPSATSAPRVRHEDYELSSIARAVCSLASTSWSHQLVLEHQEDRRRSILASLAWPSKDGKLSCLFSRISNCRRGHHRQCDASLR